MSNAKFGERCISVPAIHLMSIAMLTAPILPGSAARCKLMQEAKSNLQALGFSLPAHAADDEDFELTQMMVFFADINLSFDALEHLFSQLPDSRKHEVAARRTTRVNRRVIRMDCDMLYRTLSRSAVHAPQLSIWIQVLGVLEELS
ncbi:hypothetical protein DFH08DRAFT_825697 [Mycena albidolilacea]|uniref:Uncharacterized protein n=1 Tax=Mycena albidolilacea TaxID=1033008 RepID=A0AAD7E9V2_9AGAR|nr:hypothetical protein DFH08DRAFT_825697 [Mycena albidolilacea]